MNPTWDKRFINRAKLSTRHAWAKRGKSGYNLKWKAAAIEEMIAYEDAA